MTYEKFAYLYDELMKDVPYDKWVDLLMEKTEKYAVNGRHLLDLACGTGELSIRLARAGFSVSGVDLSADMLTVAQAKAAENRLAIGFYQQNMAEVTGFDEVDIAGIFCDSLNYLETKQDVKDTFRSVNSQLKKGGLFLFDVHSIYKVTKIFMNETFAVDGEKISYIWNCFPGDVPNSVEHDLIFFVLDELSGKYDRFQEYHKQRTFPIYEYEGWLQEAGFDVLEILADFEDDEPDEQSERIFFIARKK
ncbi:class I SAM-dependent DNA methyltransferase [Bacillus sp. V33-4]|uniref:class I SAM-dependent DNA methyltransferase n=1 Tax=Bacillus sp. V33-4 TaxID=2054169 RepID=UPI000C75E6A3|nr:class I SAM-dependent methyltransferase [Bacillus sp. V33-4]PLR87665.1 SAM-dependent methyltransferase [Bacillus sp. V33-4]